MDINQKSNVKIFSVNFNDLANIRKYCSSGEPKNGVYVDCDCKFYPCFDSYDYVYEYRFYWNFVFARSKEEFDDKMKKLKGITPGCNYCKFTDELYPMIYFEGDTHHSLDVTEGNEV